MYGAEFARCYCPECRACYCEAHWRLEDVFEDFAEDFAEESDGVWYDCTYGICPHGHRTMLND